MFSPLHRLCPPGRCNSRLSSAGSHNSARTAIRSRLCSPNTFLPLPILHTFYDKSICYRTRALFLSAQAWRPRISLKTRSAHACAVQTLFRPSFFGGFFKPFSLKCIGLLHFGAALLRLSHAWPFSTRNAIPSRLCSPNTHSPRPFFHLFAEMLVFYCARPLLLRARALRPRISHKTLSAHACAVQTCLSPSNFGVFFNLFH